MTEAREQGFTDLLETLRGISQAFLLACVAVTLLTVTFLSAERYRGAKADLELVERLANSRSEEYSGASPTPSSVPIGESDVQEVARAISSVSDLDPLVLQGIVRQHVAIRCADPSEPCALGCRTRDTIPSREDDSLATWLAFLAVPPRPFIHYQIESGLTERQLPGPEFQTALSGYNSFVLVIDECRVAETPNEALIIAEIPLRMDDSSKQDADKLAVTIEQPLRFQARRLPTESTVDPNTLAAITRLHALEEDLLRRSIDDCAEALDDMLAEASTSIEIAGIGIKGVLIERFASYFLLAYSLYFAIHFLRLRRYARDDVAAVLRESAWFPLFPRDVHLALFVLVLLVAPILATRRDLVAVLIGESGVSSAPDRYYYLIGVTAGFLASASALVGLYPLRSIIEREG